MFGRGLAGSADVLAYSRIAVVVVAIGALYAYLGLNNPYIGFLADDALYLLMADIYAPTIEATLPVYDHIRAHSQLPPLFPLLLGSFGAGTDSLPTARLSVAAFMLLAHALFYVWLRSLAVPSQHALPLVVLHALLPITLIHVVDLWSESLYLCFTFLALLAFRYAESSRFTAVSCMAVGIVVGCAMATRTAGVAFVPAMLLLCYRSGIKRAMLMSASLALFIALIAPLDMGAAGVSYGDLLKSTFGADTLTRIQQQLAAAGTSAWQAFGYDLLQRHEPSTAQSVVLGGLLAMGLGGFVACLRHTPYAAIYLAAYCPIVAVWPFPQLMERFLFAVLPLWLFFAYRGAVLVGSRLKRPESAAPAVFIVALFLLVAPSMLATAQQLWRPFPDRAFESFRTTRYWLDATRERSGMQELRFLKGLSETVGDIATHVPATECVHTGLINMVLIKAKRIAWPPRSEDDIVAGRLGPCRYFYVTPSAVGGRRPLFPYGLIKDQTDVVAVHRYAGPSPGGDPGPVVGILLRRRDPGAGDGAAD